MRLVIATAVATLGCQGNRHSPEGSSAGSAQPVAVVVADAAVDWVTPCEAVLREAPGITPTRRVAAIINGCKPYGDWRPLLEWQTSSTDGGPRLEAIERAMDASKAYCSNAGQQAFDGALDDARGNGTQRPWRRLAETCGTAVSAEAVPRFASAPFFVLDRIARAASAESRLAKLLPAIELALPAWSLSGAGVQVAPAAVTKPEVPDVVVTVTQTQFIVGSLAHATLSAAGVAVHLGERPYPGTPVLPAELAAVLRQSVAADGAVAIIAPRGIRAHRVVDVLAATGDTVTVVLAVAAPGGPPGWTLLGTVPVALSAKAAPKAPHLDLIGNGDPVLHELSTATTVSYPVPPVLAIDDAATAEDLSRVLGAFAFKGVKQLTLAKRVAK